MLYEFATLELPFKAKTEGEQLYDIFEKLGSPSIRQIDWYTKNCTGQFNHWNSFKNFKPDENLWLRLRRIDKFGQIEKILRKIFVYDPS